ncbi:glycosyltransferase [Marinicrinis lubricantis]|uniref:Glycosyltransferase n=1 Tax=Marinicrinis lubricantis TaxID=2086470 RepID=A0ABW1IQV1_9BACL
MKIVHLPIELAGQIGALCGAAKHYGHEAFGYNYFHTVLGYKENVMIADGFEILNVMDQAIPYFDLFHFHYSSTSMWDYQDLELIRNQGKKALMHHWGNDVRMPSIAKRNNPYVNTGDSPPEDQIREKLSKIGAYISTAIVQDYEVLPYVQPYYKKVHVLPVIVDTTKFLPQYPDPGEKNPLVIHAPTNPEFKGTPVIEKVIAQLQKEIPFRYQRIEQMSNQQAIQMYRTADVVIDQMLTGSYGLLCTESMALGKPVVTYVRDDLMGMYSVKPPISNANPDTLYVVLKNLLTQGEMRRQIGIEARKFAESYHDMKVVGRQLISIYEDVLKNG